MPHTQRRMEDGQSHEMEQSEPSLAEPKYWSRDQRDLLLSHLDAVDAIDRAHAALTKAAKALKKLGGPTMAEGVSEETYRAAVRADDEAHAAYQEAKRASKETEKELGVLAEVLPQLNVARKAGRESVRQELYALAQGDIAVVQPVESPKEDGIFAEPKSPERTEKEKRELAKRVAKEAKEKAAKPVERAPEPPPLPFQNVREFNAILADIEQKPSRPPRTAERAEVSAPMSEYEEEAEASPAQSGWMTRFASRARRSRVGQAMAGLTALLGIGVGVPKVSEVVTQQMEYQEQAEALRGEMHDLAVQPMYESAFEHATPDDDAPLMQGETKTFGEARAELNQAYTVAVHNRAPFFETFSELCAVPGTDGETLDAWKCHLLYGDQFSLNDNHKVNEQAKAVLGYVSGIDEGTTELVRDVIMHQSSIDWGGGGSSKAEPTTLLSHGSAMGAGSIGPIFFTSLGQVHPAFYGEQTDFFNERLAESIDLALGVVQNEDLAHKPAAEQKKAVSAMQDALAAQTDLELQWMNVVGETTSDQSVLFDSLTVGLPDASAPGGMSTPGLERLERREAHAEVAWKKLAALYPDDQALQQTVDNVVSNIEHRDLEFYRMASERSGLIGTHADFWQAEYAARQHAPKAVDGTLAQE